MRITHKTFQDEKGQEIVAYFISNYQIITVQYGVKDSKRQNLVLHSTFIKRSRKWKQKI